MQSPSSLIFILLLGIWAAYFVQYWVRRRDHLSTARSVDQFSAAMRVLERRDTATPTGPLADAPDAARAYAVHPARGAAAATVTERVAPQRGTASPVAPVRTRRPQVRPSRRVRGITFLSAAGVLLLALPLTLLSVLPAWSLALAVALLGASLAWVRSGVRAQASLTRAHRRRQAELARLRTSAPVTAPVARRSGAAAAARTGAMASAPSQAASAQPSSDSGAQDAPEVAAEPPAPVVEVAPPAAPAAAAAPAADVMVPILDEDDIPLTWDPVPVPRPTYTMKAMAQRPEVEPAEVTPTPAPVERRPESQDPAYDGRRAAGA